MIGFAQRSLRRYAQRPRWVRWLLVIAWAAMIWVCSSLPARAGSVGVAWGYLFNLAHVLVFGVFASLLYFGLDAASTRRAMLAFVGATVYGISDELHQMSVAGRDASPWDVLSDATGAALFTTVLVWLLERRRPAFWAACALTPVAVASVMIASL